MKQIAGPWIILQSVEREMSLWIRHKTSDGKTHYNAVPFAPLAVVAMVGLLVAIILSALQAVAIWFGW